MPSCPHIRKGLRLAGIAGAEWVRFLANQPADLRERTLKQVEEVTITSMAYDASVPPELRELFVSVLESVVALWTLFRAVTRRTRPEPWVSLALAETFARGQYDSLRMLASELGTAVSEDVVPKGGSPRPARHGTRSTACQREACPLDPTGHRER